PTPRWTSAELAQAAARHRTHHATPREHLPKWRLRFAIAVSIFPIIWVLPRCAAEDCGTHWPCKPLLAYLRARHGWTGSIAPHVKSLSTKRRRRRAAARNPTAITHRARPRRRWLPGVRTQRSRAVSGW
ncbi:MAG: hypothetical protein ACRD0P_33130, partial [Stackebrandtia sp.]